MFPLMTCLSKMKYESLQLHRHDNANSSERLFGEQQLRSLKRNSSIAGFKDDEEDDEGSKEVNNRKIKIEFISDKSRRLITFGKRKAGIMKKVFSNFLVHRPMNFRP